MLVGSRRKRNYAREKIWLLVKPPPTRPLLYLYPYIRSLPRYTREPIRYLGDYLDLLTKELTYEFTGNPKARISSLGVNAKRLLKHKNIPPEIHNLARLLKKYNDFIYNPGKHDFSLPPGRKHRFTAREVVLTAYVTIKLADKIKLVSSLAREAVEKDNLYTIGGRWRSPLRVAPGYGLDDWVEKHPKIMEILHRQEEKEMFRYRKRLMSRLKWKGK